MESVDPGWAGLFGYMHRRFGLELSNAGGAPLHRVPAGERPALARIYGRLEDPGAAVGVREIAELPTAIDRITASALHCDRIPLPDDWEPALRKASQLGGYALTHAALAGEWSLENGCASFAELADLQEEQVALLVALVEQRDELTDSLRAPVDVWIEAIVMLYYLDAGDRVEPAWIEALLAAQRPDGGWPNHPDAAASDPHPTALAMWVLLENLEPDAPRITWIPPR